jgi:hypothetical protein
LFEQNLLKRKNSWIYKGETIAISSSWISFETLPVQCLLK